MVSSEPQLLCDWCGQHPCHAHPSLCDRCANEGSVACLYRGSRQHSPEWEQHLRQLSERAKRRLPLFGAEQAEEAQAGQPQRQPRTPAQLPTHPTAAQLRRQQRREFRTRLAKVFHDLAETVCPNCSTRGLRFVVRYNLDRRCVEQGAHCRHCNHFAEMTLELEPLG